MESGKNQPKAATVVFDFRGRVLNPDNQPVMGAAVYLVYESSDDAVPKPRAMTAADGTFHFTCSQSDFDTSVGHRPWTHSVIVAVSKGLGVDFRPAFCFDMTDSIATGRDNFTALPSPLASQWDRTLKLVKDDIPISGRITDTSGRAVKGATVRIRHLLATKKEDLTDWHKVVAQGEDFDVIRGPLDKDCYLPNSLAALLPSATTDSEGRFRLLGGIGRERVVRLLIEGPTIASQLVFARTRPGPTFHVQHMHENPVEFFTFYGNTVDHVSRNSVPVVGTVRDLETGKPIAGVTVRRDLLRAALVGKGSSEQFDCEFPWEDVRTETDAEGRFRLTGIPVVKKDSLELIARKAPYLMAPKTFEFGTATTSVNVEASLKRGVKLHGRISDAETDEPVDAWLTYYPLADNPQSQLVVGPSTFQLNHSPYRTDASGTYELPVLSGPGMLFLYVADSQSHRYPRGGGNEQVRRDKGSEAEAFDTKPVSMVDMNCHFSAKINPLDSAKDLEFNLRLKPSPVLKGRVLDPEGRPLAGAIPCGIRQFPLFEFPLNDASFAVQHYQPEFPRLLIFVHKERMLAGAHYLRGAVPKPLDVQLKPWGVITGRVVDSTGKPKAKLVIEGWAPLRHPTPPDYGLPTERHYLTDDEGRFRIEGLVPGLKYNMYVHEASATIGSIGLDLTVESGKVRDLGDVTICPLKAE